MMNKKLLSLMLIFSMLFAYFNVYSEEYEILNEVNTGEKVTFIVELESAGVLQQEQETDNYVFSDDERKKISAEVKNAQKNAVLMAENILSDKVQLRYTYVMNGFAIDGSADKLDELKTIDGVKNVYISEERFHKLEGDSNAMYSGQNQDHAIGIDKVWDEYTGKGMVIGIIDSELDITHPVFNKAPENPRLTKDDISNALLYSEFNAEIANTEVSADTVYRNEKIPFAFDYVGKDFDTAYSGNYHGTHVAGIAAGYADEFYGAARDAQIVFMKCAADAVDAGFYDSFLIAALDDMIKLDVDVINLSLGSDAGFTLNVYDEIFQRISDDGIAIAVSAGNSGRMTYHHDVMSEAPLAEHPDYGMVGSPSVNSDAISVASLSVPASYRIFRLNGENILYEDASLKYMEKDFYMSFNGQTLEYVYFGLANGEEEYANIDLTGKLALVDRGTNTFTNKVNNAALKGAVGIIISNTDEEIISMGITDGTIPSVTIKKSAGDKLKQSEIKEITVSDADRYPDEEDESTMATSSSWGVTPDLKLKPEITAVGQNVYSAGYDKSYKYMSGTSMASPQYAGSLAVVSEYLNKKNALMSKTYRKELAQLILGSSAVINAENNVPVTPRKQGAGVINVDNAVKTPVVLHKDGKTKVELGDKLENSFEFTFDVQNLTSEKVTYNLDGVVLTDNYITDEKGNNLVTDTRIFSEKEAKITFNAPQITVGANTSKTVTVKIELDEATVNELLAVFKNGFYVDGFVRLTHETYPEVSIPFMGFKGDWLAAPVFFGTMTEPKNNISLYEEKKMYSDETGFLGVIDNQIYKLNCDSEEKKMYYSPAVFSGFAFRLGNIRNIRTMWVRAYNSEGTDVNTWKINNVRKTIYDAYDLPTYLLPISTYADGDYAFHLLSYLDYGNQYQTNVLNLYIDSQKPAAESVYIADGYLYVKVTDNSGKMTAALINKSGDVMYGEADESIEGLYRFNLFGINLSDCALLAADNAMNSTQINISDGFEGIFDKNMLKEVRGVKIFSVGEEIINIPTTDETAVTVKYFLWDENMVPLLNTKEYVINAEN